eukprot:GFUD01035209.1.p1 GENE.GFUD01035209.1~~GFUD01035209.1.p1  ORF type:complete len:245 (-),score=77.03 GFUD01035209.1:73-807(-)
METDFRGKRYLVTGVGAGIGRGVAKQLVQLGAEVWGVSRTKANLESLQEECPAVQTVHLDLTDWEATKAALEPLPAMDGLVNNAAVAVVAPFLEVKPEDFDLLFNANVKQVINVSQIVAKKMISAGKPGSIVNVSSQASQAALADHTVYCGTKGALDMITKVAALELGPNNIRVNAVNPTVTMTAMGKVGWSDPAKAGPMLAKIPLGRFAEVEDVVNCILFLLSQKAGMVNGVTLPVDGGFLAT